jgi:hypothetical protein
MKTFTGRIRSRLSDDEGLVRFLFEHDCGMLFELRIRPQYPLPDPSERVSVFGDLIASGVIQGRDIAIWRDSADKDISSLTSCASR